MLAFAIGFVFGVLVFSLLVRLDPGPGPRSSANKEARRLHERRVEGLRGWPMALILAAAVALTLGIDAVGGWFERAAFGLIAGIVCVFVVVAARRLTATRAR